MRNKTVSRVEVLEAIRSASRQGRAVNKRAFFAKSEIRQSDLYNYFPSWKKALAAAGFETDRRGDFIETEELLADWGAVARKRKEVPTYVYYGVHGKFGSTTLRSRFGSWNNVRQAFRGFAEGKKEWAEVVKFCAAPPGSERRRFSRTAPARPREDRPVYGDPMDVPGLRNAPKNENGVVYVFGMLAAQLGFHVQAVRTAFPDCDALRWVGSGSWQNTRIEFEYESRNFKEHGHSPDGCDVIVCWVHNWKDCPPSLEVIALSEKLASLRGEMTDDGMIPPRGNERISKPEGCGLTAQA